MAHLHSKPILSRIDRGHPRAEQRTVAFPSLQHEIHPGVNHFVAERALGGFLRQRFQHRSRQHDFTAATMAYPRPPLVIASGSAHPAVTPAHGTEGLAVLGKRTAEMFTIEAMKQRQQWLQRHEGGDPNQRHPDAVSQTRPCFDSC